MIEENSGVTTGQRVNISTSISESVKSQKYTITPFKGDYKDWIRFWNQFSSKGNIDILGLPHTEDGYDEAKKILNGIYGKDIKVHKQLIKEIESLQPITRIHKRKSIQEFYNKLARTVRNLTTMKKLDSSQCLVYTLMDK